MSRLPLLLTLLAAAPAFAGRAHIGDPPGFPSSFEGADSEAAAPTTPWWESFEDAGLRQVMRIGLDANYDLRAASDRIRLADAASQARLAPLLPQLSFSYNITGAPDEVAAGRTGFLTEEMLPDFTYNANGSIDAQLALDLSGRDVLGYQAARRDKLAVGNDRAEIALAVANRVAGAWFDIALHRQRLALLEQQIRSNTEVLELAELAFARGEGSAVQVLQQRQQLEATRAQLPLVEAAARIAGHQLAILLGKPPGALDLTLPSALPALPPAPAVGKPSELLSNRPDLRAADARLDAAWQRRMASERAFLPSLAIGTSLSGAYSNTQDINIGLNTTVEYGSYYGWGLNASVRMPIFDGGLTIANLRSARANEAAAAHTFGATSLLALAEVQSAIDQEAGQQARLQAVQRQAEAAKAAFAASLDRYREGAGDYLTVLSTLIAHQNADLAALQAHRDVLSARITLHDALGGAWTRDLTRTTSPEGSR